MRTTQKGCWRSAQEAGKGAFSRLCYNYIMNPWEPRDSLGDHYYLTPNNKAFLNPLNPQPQSSLSSASLDSHVPPIDWPALMHKASTKKEHTRSPMQTCRGLQTPTWFQFQTTWGSDSSPSSSLKRSSAPNFRIAVSSSLLNGFELQEQMRRKMGFGLLSQHCYSTKPYQSFS